MVDRIARNLILALASVLVFLGLNATTKAEDFAIVEELVKRVPQLGPDNPDLDAFSLRISFSGMAADIRWKRNEPMTLLLLDAEKHKPIVLLADDILLVNDPLQKTIWMANSEGLYVGYQADKEGKSHIQIETTTVSKNDEKNATRKVKSLLIDLPSLFRLSLSRSKIRSVEFNENGVKSRLSYVIEEPLRRIAAEFVTKSKQPLISFEETTDETRIRIDRVAINSNALQLLKMPHKDAIRYISNVNTERHIDKDKPHLAIQVSISEIQASAPKILPVRFGLIDPANRSKPNVPRYIDWDAVEAHDEEIAPALLKVIVDAQADTASEQ